MSNQVFAKLAVFLLIAGNVGAYYVFWPDRAPAPLSRAPGAGEANPRRAERGSSGASGLPASERPTATQRVEHRSPDVKPPLPNRLPADLGQTAAGPLLPDDGLGISATNDNGGRTTEPPFQLAPGSELPPALPPAPEVGEMPSIPMPALPGGIEDKAQAAGSPPTPKPATPPAPPAAEKDQTQVLESLKNNVPRVPGVPEQALKLENSPWTLQMEIAGGQTLLLARLQKRAEIRILCDHVELKAPNGVVQAVGKVTVTGGGLTASCQRLTLPLSEDRLLLEGQAEVKLTDRARSEFEAKPNPFAASPPTAGGSALEVQGDRLTLRVAGNPAPGPQAAAPAPRPAARPAPPAPLPVGLPQAANPAPLPAPLPLPNPALNPGLVPVSAPPPMIIENLLPEDAPLPPRK